MREARVTRGAFMRTLGSIATMAVGATIVMTPRQAFAIASGASTLTKVTTVKKLKAGVNGPYKFAVDGAEPNSNSIFLISGVTGAVTALEATCRHRGCPVAWTPADNRFECPCHGSEFSSTGKVVLGPAQQNLYSHKVVVRAGQVWVLSSRSSA